MMPIPQAIREMLRRGRDANAKTESDNPNTFTAWTWRRTQVSFAARRGPRPVMKTCWMGAHAGQPTSPCVRGSIGTRLS
jgi:hypothetical protein